MVNGQWSVVSEFILIEVECVNFNVNIIDFDVDILKLVFSTQRLVLLALTKAETAPCSLLLFIIHCSLFTIIRPLQTWN
jgi:hypothetical protein